MCGFTFATGSEPLKRSYRRIESHRPDRTTRRDLRAWALGRLDDGVEPDELVEVLVERGFDGDWSREFIDRQTRAIEALEPEPEYEGSFARGLVFGLVCSLFALIALIAGGPRPATRRGILVGTVLNFLIALILARR